MVCLHHAIVRIRIWSLQHRPLGRWLDIARKDVEVRQCEVG